MIDNKVEQIIHNVDNLEIASKFLEEVIEAVRREQAIIQDEGGDREIAAVKPLLTLSADSMNRAEAWLRDDVMKRNYLDTAAKAVDLARECWHLATEIQRDWETIKAMLALASLRSI